MNSLSLILFTALLFLTNSPRAFAQLELLPKGVGLYQYGYRSYGPVNSQYDESGATTAIGARFDQNFDGETMGSGAAGPELQRLVTELNNLSAAQGEGQGLGDSLHLGQLSGEVEAKISAQILGLGFGLTNWLTFFAGVPLVSAEVNTDLYFQGANNAQSIKAQLGDVAFDELQDGLARAAAINGAQVQSSIEEKGYAPLAKWSHQGVGDVRLGLKTGKQWRMARRVRFGLGLTTQLELPTGYVEDPDILTDVNLGKGYYATTFILQPRLRVFRYLMFGSDLSYGKNFATTLEKRVPEGNESLVAAERKTTVNMQPGDDLDVAGSAGLAFSFASLTYRNGVKTHHQDSYSGSLPGNYAALSAGSDTMEMYHEGIVAISTANAYRKGSFPIPFILSFIAHSPYAGKNTTIQPYYELSLASFFSSPWAETESPKKSKRARLAQKKKQKRSFTH